MRRILIPGLLCLFLAALYSATLAPGLTWKFDGADGGDLVTAAATGGVPHPTGYPTYLLIAFAFLRIPFGSLAFRTNLLSAVCSVAAALVLYEAVRSFDHSDVSASIAGLALGTFPLVWSQAIITEVYALHALFVTLLLGFSIVSSRNRWTQLGRGTIAGVAVGNHLSIIFAVPLMFLGTTTAQTAEGESGLRRPGIIACLGSIPYQLIGLCMGLSVYLVIPLRAHSQAPINWGHAANWAGFIWLVSGRMYWGRLLDFGSAYLLTGLRDWSHLVLQQLSILGAIPVFFVLAALFKRSRIYMVTAWLMLVYSAFAIVFYSPDSYVYLIPALIALSVWIGLGYRWLTEQVPQGFSQIRPIAACCIAAVFVARAILGIPAMNLSTDHTAERYAQLILESAPAKAILITSGDEETFSLWYFHYAYHSRPDIAVVSSDLLVQPWYHDVLQRTYPDLVVPVEPWAEALMQANSQRPVCRLPSIVQPQLECIG